MMHDYAREKLTLLLRDIDRYTADEFRRQMARIISGATGQDVPDDCHTIKAERDALAAHVERLRRANEAQKFCDIDLLDVEFSKTPQQCLRNVQAEAGRAGFITGFNWSDCLVNGESTSSASSAIDASEKYAAIVRQGGAE